LWLQRQTPHHAVTVKHACRENRSDVAGRLLKRVRQATNAAPVAAVTGNADTRLATSSGIYGNGRTQKAAKYGERRGSADTQCVRRKRYGVMMLRGGCEALRQQEGVSAA